MKSGLLALVCSLTFWGCSPSSESEAIPAPPIDLAAAVSAAQSENKWVLLDFTGSDWCPPCKKLQSDVFSTSKFQAFAKTNLTFLEVDFPRGKRLSEAQQKTNEILGAQFGIEGLPTLVLLNETGQEVWRNTGYPPGGLEQVLSELEQARKK